VELKEVFASSLAYFDVFNDQSIVDMGNIEGQSSSTLNNASKFPLTVEQMILS